MNMKVWPSRFQRSSRNYILMLFIYYLIQVVLWYDEANNFDSNDGKGVGDKKFSRVLEIPRH